MGGRGSPFVTVLSFPVEPPRGPSVSYWPERFAVWPGLSFFDFDIALSGPLVQQLSLLHLHCFPKGTLLNFGRVPSRELGLFYKKARIV